MNFGVSQLHAEQRRPTVAAGGSVVGEGALFAPSPRSATHRTPRGEDAHAYTQSHTLTLTHTRTPPNLLPVSILCLSGDMPMIQDSRGPPLPSQEGGPKTATPRLPPAGHNVDKVTRKEPEGPRITGSAKPFIHEAVGLPPKSPDSASRAKW